VECEQKQIIFHTDWDSVEANDCLNSTVKISLRIAATQYYRSSFFLFFLIIPSFRFWMKRGAWGLTPK